MLGHILMTAVNAVLPIVLLILLGYWLRQKNFLNDTFIKTGNALVFNICLPCMLFINVYDIEGFESISWDIVIYSVAMVFVIFFLTSQKRTKLKTLCNLSMRHLSNLLIDWKIQLKSMKFSKFVLLIWIYPLDV